MIGGLKAHDGGPALAIHVANTEDNEFIEVRTHGLSASTIKGAIAEMLMMAAGCRAEKPLIHSFASPSIEYTEKDWAANRWAFERAFGLQGHPCIEIFHLKYGPGGRVAAHVHRIYLRIRIDGTAVSLSHKAAIQEKVSRISEHMAGERFTSGRYNRSVIEHLLSEGDYEVAAGMLVAGLDKVRARQAPSPEERAMTERLDDLAADEVWRRCYTAWCRSDTGTSFKAALLDSGLRLAAGTKCPVVVSGGGAVHPLLRSINKGGARETGHALRKKDLDARLLGLDLPNACDLEPIPGFEPGLFGITGLDRSVPLPETEVPPAVDIEPANLPQAPDLDEKPAAIIPNELQQIRLTPAQIEALIALDNDFAGGAAARTAAVRAEIEARIEREIEEELRTLRARTESEVRGWSLPSIGVPDWRAKYKAQLANLPDDVGVLLAWVDRLDAERATVLLTSGTVVTLAPDHARADHATDDTIAVMIAHAVERHWTAVSISGGTREWQQSAAIAAFHAGLKVTNEHLAPVIEAEKDRARRVELLKQWLRLRRALDHAAQTGVDATEIRWEWGEIFAQLIKEPGIEQLLDKPRLRTLLTEDLDRYRRHVRRQLEPEVPRTPGGR